jgi:hypothetical protein
MSVDLSSINVTGLQANVPFDPLPGGWYNCVISSGERQPSSGGNGDLMKLELTVIDGPYAGRKIFDQLNLWNSSPVASEIAHKTLKAIYDAHGVPGVHNIAELYNKPMKVKVQLKGPETKTDAVGNVTAQYDASNKVKGYDHINSQHVLAAAAPTAGGVAGAPKGPTPWAPPGAAGPAAMGPPAPVAPPAPAAPYAPPVAPAAPFTPPAPVAPAAPAAGGWQPPAGAPAQPWNAQPGAPAAPAPVAPPAPLPPPPVAPVAPPPPAVFPPPGWTAHPSAPGYFYQGQEVVDEATLRARTAAPGLPAAAPAPGPVAPWAH